MKKNIFSINGNKFARAHARLKKFEKENGAITIGGLSLSSYLLSHTSFVDDKTIPKPIRTKRRILHIAGDFSTKPEELAGSVKLKTNLQYGALEYSLLQVDLNKLVKEYVSSASVSKSETDVCEKVSDCVKLVNDKTTITA
jgi:hypothetical protein